MRMQRTMAMPCHGTVSRILRVCLLIICLSGTVCPVWSQSAPPDTSLADQSRREAVDLFMQGYGRSLPVFAGAEWVQRTQKVGGNPFWGQAVPYKGDVELQGIVYPGLSLQYDIETDALLVLPEGDGLRLVVPKEKVGRFSLGQTRFLRPAAPGAYPGLDDSSYYRVLYEGPTMVVARTRKSLHYQPGEEVTEVYRESTAYFMMDGKRFASISSESDLVSLRGRKNKDLRKMLHTRNLRFKKAPEQTLLAAARYFDGGL